MEVNSMEDETMGMKEVQNCRCLELKERVLKAEEKYVELETEYQKRNREFESLELRFKELESEKLVMNEELRNLKESEEDSLIEQMMVNKALEFEKEVVEKEAEDWKTKFEKLVETVRKLDEIGAFRYRELELDENVKLGLELARIKIGKKTEYCEVYKDDALSREGLASHQKSGSPYITTPVKDYILGRSRDNLSSRRRVNKMLLFEDDGHKSTGVVDLCDSETEERSEKESDARDTLEEGSIGENYEDEDVEACEVNTSTPPFGRKRKRVITSEKESDARDSIEERSVENYEDEDVEACDLNESTPLSARKRKLVITDSENDDEDEDNIPISILKKLKPLNQEMPDLVDTPTTEENRSGRSRIQRRVSSRLNKQRVSKEISASSERNSTERLVGIPTTGNDEDDETEEESKSESESLDGFIVDDDSHGTVSEESEEIGEEESDGETGYADVMSRLRRDKKAKKWKWEYEGDMLADFGKDPELCMRAVCVLYRFQTEDEKVTRSSHIYNGRGFNKFDAERGTRIGNFLTDGYPDGDLKKSVEELESFEYKAVEVCEDLARRYSKQLFEIYNNREDPFFVPLPSP